MISAIVLAAGKAERMGQPKLFMPLHDKPVLQWALESVLATAVIEVIPPAVDTDLGGPPALLARQRPRRCRAEFFGNYRPVGRRFEGRRSPIRRRSPAVDQQRTDQRAHRAFQQGFSADYRANFSRTGSKPRAVSPRTLSRAAQARWRPRRTSGD